MNKKPLGPVVVDIEGTSLSEHEKERLAHPLVGMVILFTRNYTSRAQLKALCESIHEAREGILISVDHEGGRVQRFREDFTEIPAMGAIAQGWDKRPHQTLKTMSAVGFVLASELLEAGVDYSFTPVLDVDYQRSKVIGNRSFGEDPLSVTLLSQAFLSGLSEAGMANCGKHFPGHGWAQADSHVSLPHDERSLEHILNDAAPYGALSTQLHAVMTAHVAYDVLGQEPATYNHYLLNDILRERLGFTGLVFSDDLSMGAVSQARSITQRAERALKAGCDMVLVCNRPDEADELLSQLSWENTPLFQARLSRLKPRVSMSENVLESARYQEAQKTLCSFKED